jgi:uncharacterized protein YdiU (UPF0061 family)
VREVLATRCWRRWAWPTSRSFSLIETGEALQRGDEPSPTRSAVLVRLSESHVRFGSFQRHAFFEKPERITALIDHVSASTTRSWRAPTTGRARCLNAVVRRAGAADRQLDGGGVRARRAQHRQHEHHRRELRLRALPLPAALRPQLHRRLLRPRGLYSFGRQPEAVFWNLQQLAAASAW